ncbi:MAG: putative glycosyltransferase [Crocinitomix sp.]|jgi:predicted glycosyltransferase
MKFAFYFGHPAQFLFGRKTIFDLIENGHEILIQIKKKDVLEELLKSSKLPYTNIQPRERKNSRLAALSGLFQRNKIILPALREFKPDLLISSDASYAQLGFILKTPCVTILEDDYKVIKKLALMAYPFTSTILCPEVCEVGRWSKKKVGYKGYMKMAYLHPTVFKPNEAVINKYKLPADYAIIRLAQLTAYHDEGISGISEDLLVKVIDQLKAKGITPIISAEGKIAEEYTPLLLNIEAKDMHHVLAHANILICDSPSMSVEASILGIPSLRYSSFSGKISVLEELEKQYGLTYGFPISKSNELLKRLNTILNTTDFKNVFLLRKEKMLSEKINVSEFLFWFLTNYPSSIALMNENKGINFKLKYQL